jgi:acetyltransferase-like isoleucine patch superfamily enzyme
VSAELPLEITPSSKLDWVQSARAVLDDTFSGQDCRSMREFTAPQAGAKAMTHEGQGIFIHSSALLGQGSCLRGRRIYMGPGAVIGAHCRLEADAIYIGPSTRIGAHTDMVTGELILGQGVMVADHVVVDLSGGRSSQSRLLAGHGSLISTRAFINTCREVVIENEAALSPGAMIFTHSFWQSVLDGYSADFAGVRICRDAWVGAGCQVLPGVSVGPGAIVVSNSTATDDVPAFCMAGGVPAKVIRTRLKKTLSPEQQLALMDGILTDFENHLQFKGCKSDGVTHQRKFDISLPDGRPRYLILLIPGGPVPECPDQSVLITWGQTVPIPSGGAIFDLVNGRFSGRKDRFTHELRNFLRRRGIRFRPYAWNADYEKGL